MDTTPQLAVLVGRMDRDKLADTMLGIFQREIPGYARVPDAELRGEVTTVIRSNVDLCLSWVTGDAAPDPERYEAFRVAAKNRAAEGMPLEDLLRAYRLGGVTAWRMLAATATEGERDVLPAAGELVMGYVDQVSGIVTEAYLEEREHHVSEQERSLRSLLNALVRGELLTPAHHATAERLGMPMGVDLAAFAFALPGEHARAHARAAARLRSMGALALTEGDRVVGVAAAGIELPEDAIAVVDHAVPRDELFASLADVRFGVDIALRRGRTGVVALHTLALDLLLAHAPRVAEEMRDRVLLPLGAREGRGDLLNTVTTYLAARRDRQETARRLHIHPNTLDHRIRRACQLTGLDLDAPDDMATMVLALHQA
jgi:hypothetical protein